MVLDSGYRGSTVGWAHVTSFEIVLLVKLRKHACRKTSVSIVFLVGPVSLFSLAVCFLRVCTQQKKHGFVIDFHMYGYVGQMR